MQKTWDVAAKPTRLAVSRPHNPFTNAKPFHRRYRGPPVFLITKAAADVHAQDQAPSAAPGTLDDDAVVKQPVNATPSTNGTAHTDAEQGQQPAGARDTSGSPSWEGTSTGEETDWVGQKPFTWRDIDWGLASLVGGILLLSFGAYRVLNYFSVYQHSRRPKAPQVTAVVQRPSTSSQSPASTSATPAAAPAAAASSSSKPSKSSRSRKSKQTKQQADAAASEAGTAAPEAVATAGAAAGALGSPSFELPAPAGVPGAPQPSPLDAGFSSSMPGQPWAGGELGQLDLAPLAPLPDASSPLQPPELPSIQVEPPAKAVSQAELAALPTDPSLPSMRERAHIAMRASGAAMEASQRAAAYSAAASSAASRAAEAAEQAAAAAAAVQAALERAADEAMAAAVKRMNRAVEMVADAESRAAAAAAMATAYQDISDGQAAAAAAAADLPAVPARQGPAGHMANLQQVLHEQMFSVRTVLGDFLAGIWGGIVGAVAAVQAVLAAVWAKLLGLFGVGVGGGGGGAAGAAGGGAAAAVAGQSAAGTAGSS